MGDYWTCEGSVRGECGVKHRTESAAADHCRKHMRDVKAGHGPNAYSDRRPVRRASSPADELTLTGAAEHLGLSPRTIEDYRLDGRFPDPVRRVGRSLIWTREQLGEWRAGR